MGANTSTAAEKPREKPRPKEKRIEIRPIPTVFHWFFGAKRHVFITGSWNNYSVRIPLTKSDDDFLCIVELPPGKHTYKFVVDDEWRIDPTATTVPDGRGNMNNEVEVKQPPQQLPDAVSFETLEQAKADEEGYGQIPHVFEKYPPPLPSHLCFSYLNPITATAPPPSVMTVSLPSRRRSSANFASTATSSTPPRPPLETPVRSYSYMRTKPNSFHLYAGMPPPPRRPGAAPPQLAPRHKPVDAVGLPVPAQVTLDHLYFPDNQPDGVIVMSAGQRYHHKYATVVFFKPSKVVEDKPLDSIVKS